MPRATRGAAVLALAGSLLFGSCFHGHALWGERCEQHGDCGPDLACQDDAVCADARMCDELALGLADLRPEVALLLDHSGSMQRCLDAPDAETSCDGSDPLGPSRWNALGDLVRAVVPEFEERLDLAAVVFPSELLIPQDTAVGCNLDDSTAIGFGEPDAAGRLLTAVRAERTPKGENPVREALSGLFEPQVEGPIRARAIVLVTDNPPNCSDITDLVIRAEKLDAEVLPLVEQYRAAGVQTIVIAINVADEMTSIQNGDYKIDDINPHDYFSELALAGGAAQEGPEPYLHLADSAARDAVAAGLRERLEALTADHDACRVRLAAPPDYPDLVAVEFDGRLHRPDPECADGSAWRYVGDDHRALQLCPAACERFSAGSRARIRFGCP